MTKLGSLPMLFILTAAGCAPLAEVDAGGPEGDRTALSDREVCENSCIEEALCGGPVEATCAEDCSRRVDNLRSAIGDGCADDVADQLECVTAASCDPSAESRDACTLPDQTCRPATCADLCASEAACGRRAAQDPCLCETAYLFAVSEHPECASALDTLIRCEAALGCDLQSRADECARERRDATECVLTGPN